MEKAMYAMTSAGMHPSVKNSAALIAAYESGEQWEKLERLMASMTAAGMTPRMDVWARILDAYEKGEQVQSHACTTVSQTLAYPPRRFAWVGTKPYLVNPNQLGLGLFRVTPTRNGWCAKISLVFAVSESWPVLPYTSC
jgi:hypothetical protein